MSIADRIQAINDHLVDDYKVLRLAGADLTNVNKNIVNLKMSWKERLLYFMNNGTDEVWNNWDKVSGTGTTLSLNNTEEAPMSLTYKGNTSQTGTPTPSSPIPVQVVSGDNSIKVEGKNLFDKNNLNTLVAYIPASGTITPANGNYMVWFKIAQNTDFAISLTQIAKSTSPYVDDIQIGLYQNTPVLNATGTRIYSGTRPSATEDYTYTYSFNSGANNYIAIKVANNDRTDATATLNTLQLEKGNQATTYEEYKSASYPISLGYENQRTLAQIISNYALTDPSNNKGWVAETGDYTLYIPCKQNTEYKVTKVQSDRLRVATTIDKPTTLPQTYQSYNSSDTTQATITTNSSAKYLVVFFRRYSDTLTMQEIFDSIKIEEVGGFYTELCKIGTYQDKIDKSSGKNLVEGVIVKNNIGSTGVILVDNSFDMHIAKIEQGKTYTVTSSDNQLVCGFFTNYPQNNSISYNNSRLVQNNMTFTAPITGYIAFRSATGYATPMLNEGQTALPYEPYGTSWYLKKEIGKYTFTGNESWVSEAYGVNTWICTAIRFSNYVSNQTQILSNIFNGTSFDGRGTSGDNIIFSRPNNEGFTIRNTTLTTQAQVQSATSGNYMIYQLPTPTYTEITDTTIIGQLEALKKSYEEQTNISQVNNDMPFELNITALSNE